MDRKRRHMTERILHHTLEIIHLLTGEGYTVMPKSGRDVTSGGSTCDLGGWNETKSPITQRSNDLKILELANQITKIIHLLTGEVPIKCQDVAVYFSMEEWEYIERHQDLYKDMIMDNHQTLPSVDGLKKKNTPERCPNLLYLNGYKDKDHCVLRENQGEDLTDVEVLEVEEQKCVSGELQCLEEKIPTHITVENSTRNTLEENLFSSTDCTIEKHISQQDCSGVHTVTINVPLVHPVTDVSPDVFNYDGCFADKTEFMPHTRANKVHKVFSCSECYKCFNSPAFLIRHQRTHTGEKPFSCSICGKCFTLESNLRRHHRVHTGEKRFPCPDCGKWFAQKSGLLRHQAIHRGKKPFPCPECGKCFTHKPNFI